MVGESPPPRPAGLHSIPTLPATARRALCRWLVPALWAVAARLIALNRLAAGLRHLANGTETSLASLVGWCLALAIWLGDQGIEPGAPPPPPALP